MLNGLLGSVRFAVSRSKIMLKRRKAFVKHRPMSKKKLKEEAEVMNMSNEFKKLQVMKELQKVHQGQNRHKEVFNLMRELFHPTIMPNQGQQVSFAAEDPLIKANPNYLLPMTLRRLEIATDIIKFGRTNFYALLQLNLLVELFGRIRWYFTHLEEVEGRVTERWRKSIGRLAIIQRQKQSYSNPHQFLKIDELDTYAPWRELVELIALKLDTFTRVSQFITATDILNSVRRAVQAIPAKLYDSYLRLMFRIDMQQVPHSHKVLAVGIAARNKRLRYDATAVVIDPQILNQAEKLLAETCNEILSDPSCTIEDIATVIRTTKGQLRLLTAESILGNEQTILRHLSQASFELVVDILQVYRILSVAMNKEVLTLLKYDLYRKVLSSQSTFSIISVLRMLSQRSLNVGGINLPSFDLVEKLSQKISLLLKDSRLGLQQLKSIFMFYFNNWVTNWSHLELFGVAFIQQSEGLQLQQTITLCSRLKVLGYNSKAIAIVLLGKLHKDFKQLYQMAADEIVMEIGDGTQLESDLQEETQQGSIRVLLGRKNSNKSKNKNVPQTNPLPNPRQIALQQSLVLGLFTICEFYQQLSYDKLLSISQTTIFSDNALIAVLIQKVNAQARKIGIPQMKLGRIKLDKLKREKQISLKNDTLKSMNFDCPSSHLQQLFTPPFAYSQVQKCVSLEAKISGQFMDNSSYNPHVHMFLEEKWLPSERVYKQDDYIQWLRESKSRIMVGSQCYFNAQVNVTNQLVELRKSLLESKSVISMNIQKEQILIVEKEAVQSQNTVYYELSGVEELSKVEEPK